MFAHFRLSFWIPLSMILLPSTILHIRLLVLIWRYRHKEMFFKSPFYRLFFVQSIIELILMFIYHASGMIVRDRILGDDFLISTNEGVFGKLYYVGTIYYFHHAQVWGVIIRSFARCVAVCAPTSRVQQCLETCTALLWAVINITVPFVVVFRLFLQEAVYFEENDQGRPILCSPPEVLLTNGAQATIVSVVGTVISAACFVLALRNLHTMKKHLSFRQYRHERQLTFIGLTLFFSLCGMTAYYLTVTLAAIFNPDLVNSVRPFYIVPVMLLTFVNPWMLALTNRSLRSRLLRLSSSSSATEKPVRNAH